MNHYKNLNESDVIKCISPLRTSPGVFLESALCDADNHTSFLFAQPARILTYNHHQSVQAFFNKINHWRGKGYWIAGYFSYEFGYALEPALHSLLKTKQIDFPLAWLGVFKHPIRINHNKCANGYGQISNRTSRYVLPQGKFNTLKHEYTCALSKIKYYLKEGETYQVNHTLKYKTSFAGDILDLYVALRKNQSTSYAGFINDGQRHILSFSPELFFKTTGNKIVTKPMKGTYQRGKNIDEDVHNKMFLKNDLKNRAENMMIVDLLRNDLGKIARPGSVKVSDAFNVETYPSLHQMTSRIRAELTEKVSVQEIFKAIFPSGSVTGAPKIRTMKIIHELEKEPRDVYTGSIGFISPDNKMCFNVAIRTLLIDKHRVELGVGGGIVADSKPDDEYRECKLKSSFLHKKQKDFSLIETMLWEKGIYQFFNLHGERLKKSAEYFNMPFSLNNFKRTLFQTSMDFAPERKYTVRVLLNSQGKTDISHTLLKSFKKPVSITLSTQKVHSHNVFLYHKTTNRKLYDRERKKALQKGFFEVLFLNENNELTEGTISNIFIKKNGMLYTPKMSSGLLPGVLRAHLLQTGAAEEKPMSMQDLDNAEQVYIGNSVRGLIPAQICPLTMFPPDGANNASINSKLTKPPNI